jgi:hypothetical protein
MNRIYIIFFALFIVQTSFGQINDSEKHQKVLATNITDSLFIFGEWNENEGTETHLIYLGLIKTDKENYKIMTSIWFWGLSKRATSRILVFNDKNEYLGNYYVGMTYELPEKIENNQLLFLHSKADYCDSNTITRLSFENGIPKDFFLECKDGSGEIYSFDKEDK